MTSPANQANGHADASTPAVTSGQTSKIQPNDVGWQFVPQYYNFVNKQPHRLHCFYNKRSTFIHGEEGEEAQIALGQQEIHERIVAIGYNQCKVYIHSIDSQSSSNGGIIILVIGEMSNNNGPWRKFTQTFFLAEQPNGYFVLNDIFRYLKEDVDEDEEVEEEPAAAEQAQPQATEPEAPAAPAQAEPVEAPKASEELPQEPASAPAAEPEPVSAPAQVNEEVVGVEAVVASVPDKDISPSEPSLAVEEPITSAPSPPAEETPAPAAPKAASPAPAAPKAAAPSAPAANGTSAPAPAAAPAAPAAPPKPKTWASLAASSAGRTWGSIAATNVQPVVSTPAAPLPQKKEEPAAPAAPAAAAAPAASTSTDKQHPFYTNATRVQTPHCFVKLPNWSAESQHGGETMSENDLRNAAARFGEVKKVEIVKSKACAFVEFVRVESARKAIIASLPASQGGEDGVKIGEGRLNFETRKEKDERRPKGGRADSTGAPATGTAAPAANPAPAQGGQGQRAPRPQGQANGGQGQGQGQRGQGGRGRGGRGGAQGGNQGDRAAAQANNASK
ncbi:hypothetical protein CI109_100275 [Kwoniella shandongensis]|uniref:Uncharacterized protein n=1 Tax=Kwoniella shandongensis TaxID=1734106 RepID=A0A5M6C5A1_9TREE|nr:uncharacterized protein CI109_001880 [Kwoniella shandongensis]KAA5529940.1 hypothetical protein CI109_001880 [Kwoniella shandongensis]